MQQQQLPFDTTGELQELAHDVQEVKNEDFPIFLGGYDSAFFQVLISYGIVFMTGTRDAGCHNKKTGIPPPPKFSIDELKSLFNLIILKI